MTDQQTTVTLTFTTDKPWPEVVKLIDDAQQNEQIAIPYTVITGYTIKAPGVSTITGTYGGDSDD